MRVIPYRTLRFETAAPPETVISLLKSRVWEVGPLKLGRTEQPFRGRVTGDGFKISRQIRYRNSFLPVLIGTLRRSGSGTEVAVVMRMHLVVAAFSAFWLAGVLSALVGITSSHGPLGATLAIAGMLVFGLALVGFSFGIEASKAEALLTELLGKL